MLATFCAPKVATEISWHKNEEAAKLKCCEMQFYEKKNSKFVIKYLCSHRLNIVYPALNLKKNEHGKFSDNREAFDFATTIFIFILRNFNAIK